MSDQRIIVKKVRKVGKAPAAGTWKVAFADFMTAMMAFFLVMWIIGLDENTRSAIAGYFNDPLDFNKKAKGSTLDDLLSPKVVDPGNPASVHNPEGLRWQDEERAELERIRREFETAVAEDPDLKEIEAFVDSRITDEGLVIEFLEGVGNVFFETGSATVRPIARKIFVQLGEVLAEAERHIAIDGHTDSRPYPPGARYDNWHLSQDRALATLTVIRSAGVKDRNVLAVRGFADRRLRFPEDPLHFSNRRVTVLLPFRWMEERVVGSARELKRPLQAHVAKPIDIRSPQKPSE